ncbi:MAG: GNAT family N-acetyltransferase [Chloroflexota bacterium]|nr:GNAT family N-acetyltransferase [Chloroflexota bacterium]
MGAFDAGQVVIREARPDDAAQMIAHMQTLAEEPDSMIVTGPGEFTLTVEEERAILEADAKSDNSVFMVAEANGQIIGLLDCSGGKRKANRHSTYLGISIRKEWRGQGVGTALMVAAIEWARGTGIITRMELEVFAHNARAIHVYEKCGFQVEGTRRKAFYRDGQYIDSITMALLF